MKALLVISVLFIAAQAPPAHAQLKPQPDTPNTESAAPANKQVYLLMRFGTVSGAALHSPCPPDCLFIPGMYGVRIDAPDHVLARSLYLWDASYDSPRLSPSQPWK